jgi:hypothetical protein
MGQSMRYDILTAVNVLMMVFWVEMQCELVGWYHRRVGIYLQWPAAFQP